ncbi:VanZ family protein [uncultured Photobacterium sp.]|uniref:VanZ family protein n=1 Tax=uncultured Photobacterium sp. TaxID=173973 RepID=UPI0026174B1F|nr:VanZ family protein [uncultured Photobacterium sp.]
MTSLIKLVQKYWAALTLAILFTITFLSLTPITELPDVPGTDKTHHFIAYAALMFPVALRKPKHWLFIGLLFVGWSGMIELVQPYVNRYGEWLDLAANTGGLICGYVLAGIITSFHFTKS